MAVLRNYPFEHVESVWSPFLAFAGLGIELVLEGYDGALTLAEVGTNLDAVLVTLDLDLVVSNRTPDEIVSWLDQRIGALRVLTTAPVVVTNWVSEDQRAPRVNTLLDEVLSRRAGVHVADLAGLSSQLGGAFFDDRAVDLRGTRWSDAAVLAVARALSLQWLPAVLSPVVKVLAVDLDETLYSGVLGEDGLDGVRLTPAHSALHDELLRLKSAGVFLALSSRNQLADVQGLFAMRTDFPLRWADFSAVVADWEAKAEHLSSIAAILGVGEDAVAFLDDNPGELASVGQSLPEVMTLHAADPVTALMAVRHCPGLFRFRKNAADELRVEDKAAGATRAHGLREAQDPDAYVRSLAVVLTCRQGDPRDVARIAELSAKTNQFSTALRRTPVAELDARLRRGEVRTVAVDLSDRLSDSGTVAAVVARREAAALVLEEVMISCRALGRGVEDALLAQALLMLADDGVESLEFEWTRGPRNEPALAWLRRLAGGLPDGSVPWAPRRASEIVRGSPLTVRTPGAPRVG